MPKIVTLKVPSSFLKKLDIKPSTKGSSAVRANLKKNDVGSSPSPGTPQPHTGGAKSMAAFNASLRALDKSGKPCRRWIKGQINIKSFTGVEYTLVAWKGVSLESEDQSFVPVETAIEKDVEASTEIIDTNSVDNLEEKTVKSEAV